MPTTEGRRRFLTTLGAVAGTVELAGCVSGGLLAFPRLATQPTTATVTASRRGDYTLSCLTDCGYGHAYMDRDGALAVR